MNMILSEIKLINYNLNIFIKHNIFLYQFLIKMCQYWILHVARVYWYIYCVFNNVQLFSLLITQAVIIFPNDCYLTAFIILFYLSRKRDYCTYSIIQFQSNLACNYFYCELVSDSNVDRSLLHVRDLMLMTPLVYDCERDNNDQFYF